MMRLSALWILLAGTILLASSACAVQPVVETPTPTLPPLPTPLPTAVPPEIPAGAPGDLALPFIYEFEKGSIPMGFHRYGFLVSCPGLTTGVTGSDWINFTVSQTEELIEGPVYLRLAGISTDPLGGRQVFNLHPDQEIIAIVTFIGVTEESAQQARESQDCEIIIRLDDKSTLKLLPGETYKP
jgi:hypothetical protein